MNKKCYLACFCPLPAFPLPPKSPIYLSIKPYCLSNFNGPNKCMFSSRLKCLNGGHEQLNLVSKAMSSLYQEIFGVNLLFICTMWKMYLKQG